MEDVVYEWDDADFVEPEYDSETTDAYTDTDGSEIDCEIDSGVTYDPVLRCNVRPNLWVETKLGDTTLHVCSKGMYRLENSLTEISGIQLHGTPFRYTVINGNTYFMHDIVWQAFYGVPPANWEVRHKQAYTSLSRRRVYSNRLANLETYPVVVTTRIVNFSSPPDTEEI